MKFKTSQAKTLDIVEKMFYDLKVKTESTSKSVACTISSKEKEIVSDENTDFDSLSFVSAKKVFDDDLLEKKKICWKLQTHVFYKTLVFKTYLT